MWKSKFDEESKDEGILNMEELGVSGVRKKVDLEFAKNDEDRDALYIVKDKEWLERSGTVCPICRRRIDVAIDPADRGKDYTDTENTVEQEIACPFKDCQAYWSEVYVLKAYVILDNGLKQMADEDFDHILYEKLLPQYGLEMVLKIPGVRELVKDHFEEDVKDMWIEQQEREHNEKEG